MQSPFTPTDPTGGASCIDPRSAFGMRENTSTGSACNRYLSASPRSADCDWRGGLHRTFRCRLTILSLPPPSHTATNEMPPAPHPQARPTPGFLLDKPRQHLRLQEPDRTPSPGAAPQTTPETSRRRGPKSAFPSNFPISFQAIEPPRSPVQSGFDPNAPCYSQ
jgi:hypothetical protein